MRSASNTSPGREGNVTSLPAAVVGHEKPGGIGQVMWL
ncbi:MAG: hypothetical protein AVDCRST_MAG01-01-189 [uncultured Rubrobacteraceae bacterium]|uniref:Uncharacterized protein n=1 Tax=uncultured Rubrobacteraceae bacterium TaxID=349277 RepID=A0A6J4NHY6_9ACTN|nr:MAG: hypothetical protein AVDCRST_MAG01-01-189 [uncultured Rubrobacteraceae bacterium]